ncbi:MAG TPA: TolC family outer membrane protein [Caulobacteraceae bacterium]|nr:TolC family outer membrane protein [Caulobacteraceae bacterium]
MTKQSGLPAAVAVSIALCGATSVCAETLADAIALAYQTNPTLQGQRATLRSLDENVVQAQAGYRPQLGAQASITTDSNNLGALNPLNTTPGQTQTSQAGLTITQPIYTGGLVSSQVNAAEATVYAGREVLRQVEEQVLQNVITAYTGVRRDEEGLEIARENARLLDQELAETRARFEVGEITRTDVAQTEASVAGAQAQLSTAEGQLAISRATYAQVVGQNPGTLAPEPSLARLLPATIDEAFDAAESKNPQILEARYNERASSARIEEAKAAARPTVELRGAATYAGGNVGTGTPFANYSHDVSATVVAQMPLFTGGLNASKIRQAAENNNVDRIAIETTRRTVLQAVAQAWNELLAARANVAADQEQVRAGNIAFEGMREEEAVGLRTVLDVLITEQNLANAQFSLVNARYDEYAAATALLVGMGDLYASDLATVPIYDPARNYHKVTHGVGFPLDAPIAAIDQIGAPEPKLTPPPPPR